MGVAKKKPLLCSEAGCWANQFPNNKGVCFCLVERCEDALGECKFKKTRADKPKGENNGEVRYKNATAHLIFVGDQFRSRGWKVRKLCKDRLVVSKELGDGLTHYIDIFEEGVYPDYLETIESFAKDEREDDYISYPLSVEDLELALRYAKTMKMADYARVFRYSELSLSGLNMKYDKEVM